MPDRAHVEARMLRLAGRLALRGHGGAEPNPCVGCVITDAGGEVVGLGFHARCGGPHAEAAALREAGTRARGGIAYVTLEPCAHEGRTPPCADALIQAGIAEVVAARLDPTPGPGGGGALLQRAGARFCVHPEPLARFAGEPWIYREATGLPWVTVKWAQTIDGRIATRTGDSKWISSPRSRAMVHRERGRTDIILTGIGTLRTDDPHLVARDTRPRRIARRVVIDPLLMIDHGARMLRTLDDAPVTVVASRYGAAQYADRAAALRNMGVDVMIVDPPSADALPSPPGQEIDLTALLRALVDRFSAAHVLVEAGPGLVHRLLRDDLVRMLWIFIGPMLLGDAQALPPTSGRLIESIACADRMSLIDLRRRGDDSVLTYMIPPKGSMPVA